MVKRIEGTKLTVALGPRTDRALTELAERQETTKAQVVRRAIALLSYLEDEVAKGATVVIRRPEGDMAILLEPGRL